MLNHESCQQMHELWFFVNCVWSASARVVSRCMSCELCVIRIGRSCQQMHRCFKCHLSMQQASWFLRSCLTLSCRLLFQESLFSAAGSTKLAAALNFSPEYLISQHFQTVVADHVENIFPILNCVSSTTSLWHFSLSSYSLFSHLGAVWFVLLPSRLLGPMHLSNLCNLFSFFFTTKIPLVSISFPTGVAFWWITFSFPPFSDIYV